MSDSTELYLLVFFSPRQVPSSAPTTGPTQVRMMFPECGVACRPFVFACIDLPFLPLYVLLSSAGANVCTHDDANHGGCNLRGVPFRKELAVSHLRVRTDLTSTSSPSFPPVQASTSAPSETPTMVHWCSNTYLAVCTHMRAY